MTKPTPPYVTIDRDALLRLVAASHLAGCADWAEAEDKAEQDLRPWAARIPPGDSRVEVTTVVLAQLAESAQSVLDAHVPDDAAWPRLVHDDLEKVLTLCARGAGTSAR
jgi:hypothetical protein